MIPPVSSPPITSTTDPAPGEQPERRLLRAAVQVVGFGIGIALLAWCAGIAFSDQNRAQLAQLRRAHWGDVALLVLLSLATVVINAGAFWTMIRPVRRVPWRRVLAVNCVATVLAYLPFKLSLLFRAAVHNRRDALPLLMIGTWLGNVGLMMLAVIGPALAATAWRGEVDAIWWAVAAGGAAAVTLAILVVARLFSHERLWRALERRLIGVSEPTRGWRRLLSRSQLLPRAHEGVRMLAHPSAVLSGAALRALDIGVQSARFLIAARIAGVDLAPDQAIAAAATYFIIGVISPTGMLGFREAGVFALLQSQSFAVVVLTVTAIEMVVNLLCALPAILLLRRTSPAGVAP